MLKPLESYTAEEQEILQFIAKDRGREFAEQYAKLILMQAFVIGEIPDSPNLDGAEVYVQAYEAMRKRKSHKTNNPKIDAHKVDLDAEDIEYFGL